MTYSDCLLTLLEQVSRVRSATVCKAHVYLRRVALPLLMHCIFSFGHGLVSHLACHFPLIMIHITSFARWARMSFLRVSPVLSNQNIASIHTLSPPFRSSFHRTGPGPRPNGGSMGQGYQGNRPILISGACKSTQSPMGKPPATPYTRARGVGGQGDCNPPKRS